MDRALIALIVDPMLRSGTARRRLKKDAGRGSAWVEFVLTYLIDPTILPPPSYTRARADAVYGEALRRAVEFVSRSGVPGDILEFGTLLGYTARWLAGLIWEYGLASSLWLYDSFEGLPEITAQEDVESYEVAGSHAWFKGAMRVAPNIERRIQAALRRVIPAEALHVIKGYYEQTLAGNLPAGKAAVVHVDCDLYASAKFVLETLIRADKLQDGTVLILDDYNCNRASPRMGERLAVAEAFASQARYVTSPWFSYGWHGQMLLVHEKRTD
jgi:hypothetical protein